MAYYLIVDDASEVFHELTFHLKLFSIRIELLFMNAQIISYPSFPFPSLVNSDKQTWPMMAEYLEQQVQPFIFKLLFIRYFKKIH